MDDADREKEINDARFAEIEQRNRVRKWAVKGVREAQRRAADDAGGKKSLREKARDAVKKMFTKDDGPPKEIYPFW